MINFFRASIFQAALLCLLIFSACSPATEITASWTNPEAMTGNYNNILIAAMTEDVATKQMIENQLASELRDKGVNVSKSIEMFPPNFREEQLTNKEAMMQAIQEGGHDAILTVAVIDEETETRYVPGAAYSPGARFPYYNRFWGYFNHMYPMVYEPGYYTEDKIYYLETNLYDAQTENLVWSAQSESTNPGNIQNLSEGFAEVTANAMENNNLLSQGTASIK